MKFKPIHYRNSEALPIFNAEGNAGIVTLWNPPRTYESKLREANPEVFAHNSNLVTITSLYGNGLAQMLTNLAYNPQISRIAVTGNAPNVVPSFECLDKFLKGNITLEDYGGIKMNKIDGTEVYVDAQLKPEMFKYLEMERFGTSNFKGVSEYINEAPTRRVSESDRTLVELIEPEFNDFPSNINRHYIIADSPLDAWKEVLWKIDRFGVNTTLKKGVRRALTNLDVTILDASFEDESLLRKWGFKPEELKAYKEQMIDGKIPEGVNYSYGNRLRDQGGDPLEVIAEKLKDNKLNRHGFVSLWNTKTDLIEGKASPCFTDAYFTQDLQTEKLTMTAGFRTHNAASAWLTNIYGMRAVHELVAKSSEMVPGILNLRSRWIGIDPAAPKLSATIDQIKSERKIKLDITDPKGYYTTSVDQKEIVVEHYSPEGVKLEEFRGADAMSLKNQLRQIDGFSSDDHAMWIGMELVRAQHKLDGSVIE